MSEHALFLSNDMMGASQVQSVARQAQIALETVGSADSLVAIAGKQSPAMVILDLAADDITLAELGALIERLREAVPTTKIVAFGPHVWEAKLSAARNAGCDAVLTRGQFHSGIAALLNGNTGPADSD